MPDNMLPRLPPQEPFIWPEIADGSISVIWPGSHLYPNDFVFW